jgi:hypothetical protein
MSVGVFLGSLPAGIGAEDVEEWLRAENFRFEFVRLLVDRFGLSKSSVIVRAATREDAEAIIARYDGAPFGGRILRASIARRKRQQEGI